MKTSWALVALLVVAAVAAWVLLRPDARDPSAVPPAHRPVEVRTEGPALLGVAPATMETGPGEHALRGRVTLDGKPAAATVVIEALEGYDWVFEGRRPTSARYEAMFRLAASKARGAAREVAVTVGDFTVDGLARGVYSVRASDAQGRRAWQPTVLGLTEPAQVVGLALVGHGERLEGRVMWSDGTAVAGAIAVEPTSGQPSAGFLEGDVVGPIALGTDGRFVAEGLPAGALVVRVLTTEGVLAIDRTPRVPRKDPWTLTLERPSQTVQGHVLSSVGEVGVAGARLLAAHAREGEGSGVQFTSAETGFDGAFRIAVVGLPVKLSVLADGFAPLEHPVRDAGTQRVLLSPLGTLCGRVMSVEDGSPAAGAVVRYEMRGAHGQAIAGADGSFVFDHVPPPAVDVWVWGGGWVAPGVAGKRNVPVPPGSRAEVVLDAVRSARLAVRVVDEGGSPVPGAEVGLVERTDVGTRTFVESLQTGVGGAFTDAAGRAELADVPTATDLWLSVRSERSERITSGPHRGGGAPVEIRLGASRWVVVTVLHADDASPAPAAKVSLIARRDSGRSSGGGPRTDERGQVRLGPIKDATYSVQVLPGAGLAASEEMPVEVPPGSTGDLAVTIRATREAPLGGTVVFPDGTPAPRVHLRPGAAGAPDASPRPVVSGARGEFRVPGLPPGEHVLTADHPVAGRVYRGTWRIPTGRTDHVLRLEDVSAQWIQLTFEVLDPQGRPVPGANVDLLDGFVSHGSTQVLAGRAAVRFEPGSPQAEALAAGRLVPAARDARLPDGTRLPLGPARGEPLAPAQRNVTLRLPPELAIEGRVLDASGAPVARARVHIEPVGLRSGSNASTPDVESDSQGRFRIGRLGVEPMRLTVRPPEEFLTPEPLEVVAGGAGIVISVERGVSARVKVLDPDGGVLAGASVVARLAVGVGRDEAEVMAAHAAADRTQRRASTDANGTAWLRGLGADVAFTLTVTPPESRQDLLATAVSSWTPSDVEVRLTAGLEVRGVVRDPEGRPLPHAIVYAPDDTNGWAGHAVAADGSFRIARRRAGPVALHAVAHRDHHVDPSAPPIARVEAGRTDVVLVLAAPVTLVVAVDGAPPSGPEPAVQLFAPMRAGAAFIPLPARPVQEGTRFSFAGLAPQRVTVWARPDAEGRYGLMHDVATDGGLARLERLPGRRIVGRISAPSGIADLRVTADGIDVPVRVAGVVRPDGTYEILGLPPGRWFVQVQARGAAGWLSTRGEVDAGGTLDLSLEDAR